MIKLQEKKTKTVHHRSHTVSNPANKRKTLKKGARVFVKKFSPVIKKLANE